MAGYIKNYINFVLLKLKRMNIRINLQHQINSIKQLIT